MFCKPIYFAQNKHFNYPVGGSLLVCNNYKKSDIFTNKMLLAVILV